jgi:hypothetical protein
MASVPPELTTKGAPVEFKFGRVTFSAARVKLYVKLVGTRASWATQSPPNTDTSRLQKMSLRAMAGELMGQIGHWDTETTQNTGFL